MRIRMNDALKFDAQSRALARQLPLPKRMLKHVARVGFLGLPVTIGGCFEVQYNSGIATWMVIGGNAAFAIGYVSNSMFEHALRRVRRG